MTHLMSRRRLRMTVAGAATMLVSLVLASGAMADPSSSGGMFVIGDQSSLTTGSEVTFWGAQWWQDNPLSTGFAPAAFKGYADTATPNCGQTWTTRPGNSSDPPATLSGTIPVIVSSQITKTGPVISGNTIAIVLVSVDPGYAGDPGHPGTGTIVGVMCPASGGSSGGPPVS